MAGRIPQEFIDEVLTRTDVVSLVGERVSLRRAGSNYKGLCPFHEEKSPSFIVSPDRQTYHCFGCGAHGTALGFLMEHDGLGFREAVTELAERNGLRLPETHDDTSTRSQLAPIYDVLQEADRRFREALRNHPARGSAVQYLQQRGVSGEIAARFGIGFAPPGWDFLLDGIGRRGELVQAGLVVERDGRHYDRFRDRITFPIRDRRGRVVGFGGRILGDGEPKYLNSPETPVFQKGREIYGLFEALQAQRRPERLVLVEGYMDVIALTQLGVPGAVATLGTATTREQAQVLLRSANQLILCFDGDDAGLQAALRACENVLPALRGDREVRVLLLPPGDDPDTFVRRAGPEAFETEAAQAQPVGDFFFQRMAHDCDRATVDGRARLLDRCLPALKRLQAGAFREAMVARLAELALTDRAHVEQLIQGRADAADGRREDKPAATSRRPEAPTERGGAAGRTPVRFAIALLLQQPDLAAHAGDPDRFADRGVPGLDLLQQLLETLRRDPTVTTARVLNRFEESLWRDALWKLAEWEIPHDDSAVDLLRDSLDRIEELVVLDEQQQALRRLEQATVETAPEVERTLRAAYRLQALLDLAGRRGLTEEEDREARALRKHFRLM